MQFMEVKAMNSLKCLHVQKNRKLNSSNRQDKRRTVARFLVEARIFFSYCLDRLWGTHILLLVGTGVLFPRVNNEEPEAKADQLA
jgi:hypothetical protein